MPLTLPLLLLLYHYFAFAFATATAAPPSRKEIIWNLLITALNQFSKIALNGAKQTRITVPMLSLLPHDPLLLLFFPSFF
jgi:hypothetical protein